MQLSNFDGCPCHLIEPERTLERGKMSLELKKLDHQILPKFLASNFDQDRSINAVLNLRRSYLDGNFHQRKVSKQDAEMVARNLQQRLNQRFGGNKFRRFNVSIPMVISIHDCPHLHLHVLVECPENVPLIQMRKFIGEFANHHQMVDDRAYAEAAKSIDGSMIYNAKFDNDRIIIF